MGKITTYIMMLSGVILLFAFAGLLSEGTLLGTLLDLTNPDTLTTSPFYVAIVAAGAILAVGGVVLGFISQGRTDLLVKGTLLTVLIAIGWTLMDIYSAIAQMDIWVARLLIAPLIIVYFLATIEWLSGHD